MPAKNDDADDAKLWILAALVLAFLPMLACGGAGVFLLLKRSNPHQEREARAAAVLPPPPENFANTQRKALPALPDAPANDPLTGLWSGAYQYPDPRPAVKFDMDLRHADTNISGRTKEPNTFNRNGEWLFANCKGQFDAETRKITWIKRYDGTAGVNSSAEYTAVLTPDGSQIEGVWRIRTPGQADFSGRFTLQKAFRDKD